MHKKAPVAGDGEPYFKPISLKMQPPIYSAVNFPSTHYR